MKKCHELWMLFAAFILTILSVFLFAESVEIFYIPWLQLSYLPYVMQIFPSFFLQLWLCRHARYAWLKWLPFILLLAIVVLLLAGMESAPGWDSIGYLILLLLCPAPAFGYGVGVLVDFLLRWNTKRHIDNLE